MFPASNWQMVRFARYLGNSVTSWETVNNYLAGVRTLHRIGGYPVPDTNDPNLDLVLRGLRFELAHATKQAKPMTPRLLFQIYQHINTADPWDVVKFAALILGFYLFLRASNLVPMSKEDFTPGEQLTVGDIRRHEGFLIVDVRWSKTVQYKQKINSLPLIPAKRTEICPVFWTTKVLELCERKKSDPLFSVTSNGQNAPLTYKKLSSQLKTWVKAAGVDPTAHTLHGLRRGGCSWALQAGLVGPEIQLMGDWVTLAYIRYLDVSAQRKMTSMVRFVDQVNRQTANF